jgi:hypothetical protein
MLVGKAEREPVGASLRENVLKRRRQVQIVVNLIDRAAVVAAEQAAAKAAEEALEDGGIEGLEAWAKAARANADSG